VPILTKSSRRSPSPNRPEDAPGGALAPYACHPAQSRGRLHAEEESPGRSCFQRDRDRIIHSAAFRRLEYKTQVFVNHEGDHYRTRLTHSLEVAQLARSMCRALRLNEDLAEALALAHDLGHTPFGHAGEEALDACMVNFGGFDHNAQTLRILTSLENRYAEFDGLNLTWETLEGVTKHNGPLLKKKAVKGSSKSKNDLPRAIAAYNALHDLELHTYAGGEAQIASLADDIAYNNHDIDDGLRAGLFEIEQLDDVPGVGAIFREVRQRYPQADQARQIHESVRRLIHRMCMDLLRQTEKNLRASGVKTAGDIRALGKPVAEFSPQMQELNLALKEFLMQNMYRHYKVNRMSSKARRVLKELFTFFHAEPDCLPTAWRDQSSGAGSTQTAGVVADFMAGMTDRFALEEHARIFDRWAKT
jgi:dGTPase